MFVKRVPVLAISMILATAGWAGTASADTVATTQPTTTGVTSISDEEPSAQGYTCGYYSGSEITQYGDTGNRVREVQCLINLRYYEPKLVVDGVFGPKTRDAVRWFQWCAIITEDGVVGKETWSHLRNPPNC